MAFLKFAVIVFLLSISFFVQAGDMGPCNGSVLQRRLALVQFGRLVDSHIATKDKLPDICSEPVKEISDGIPDLLKGALVCGSSKEGSVHYSCQIPSVKPGTPSVDATVIESCRYSLVDQSVSCENRSVVTTFEG